MTIATGIDLRPLARAEHRAAVGVLARGSRPPASASASCRPWRGSGRGRPPGSGSG